MNQLLNVVIVLGRCRRSRQLFGIRFEEKGRNRWMADWAFAMKAKAAEREGYERSEITGSFSFGAAFPGCPSCEAKSLVKCSCGRVSCWGGERVVNCPWCGNTGQIKGGVASLGASGDS